MVHDYKFTLLQETDDAGAPIEGSFRLLLTFPDGKSLVRDDIKSEAEAHAAVEETMSAIRAYYAREGIEVGGEVETAHDYSTGEVKVRKVSGKEYMN